jgi:uncharacterized membrane protein YdcZ (DUF606 family)
MMGSAIFVAVAVGVAIAVQVAVVGRASHDVHPLVVSTILQIAGMSGGILWVLHRHVWAELGAVAIRWWVLPLGLAGWGIVAALGFSSSRLGVSTTLVLVVATQLVAGLLVDLSTGAIALDLRQPFGVALVVGGTLVLSFQG